jgi:hypothetical protein
MGQCQLTLEFTSLFPAFSRSDFMSVLPQITYGNMVLFFLISMDTKKRKYIHIYR